MEIQGFDEVQGVEALELQEGNLSSLVQEQPTSSPPLRGRNFQIINSKEFALLDAFFHRPFPGVEGISLGQTRALWMERLLAVVDGPYHAEWGRMALELGVRSSALQEYVRSFQMSGGETLYNQELGRRVLRSVGIESSRLGDAKGVMGAHYVLSKCIEREGGWISGLKMALQKGEAKEAIGWQFLELDPRNLGRIVEVLRHSDLQPLAFDRREEILDVLRERVPVGPLARGKRESVGRLADAWIATLRDLTHELPGAYRGDQKMRASVPFLSGGERQEAIDSLPVPGAISFGVARQELSFVKWGDLVSDSEEVEMKHLVLADRIADYLGTELSMGRFVRYAEGSGTFAETRDMRSYWREIERFQEAPTPADIGAALQLLGISSL